MVMKKLKIPVLIMILIAISLASGCIGGEEIPAPDVKPVEDEPVAEIIEIIEPPQDPTIFDSDLIIFMTGAVQTYDIETGAWTAYSQPLNSGTDFAGSRKFAAFKKRTIYQFYTNNETWVPKNESDNMTWSFALSPPTSGTTEGAGTQDRMYVSEHNATNDTKTEMPLTGSKVGEYQNKTIWYNILGTAMYNKITSGQTYPLE